MSFVHAGGSLSNDKLKLVSKCWLDTRTDIIRFIESGSKTICKSPQISYTSLLSFQKALEISIKISSANLAILEKLKDRSQIFIQFRYHPISEAPQIICLSEKCLQKNLTSKNFQKSSSLACNDKDIYQCFQEKISENENSTILFMTETKDRYSKYSCESCNCLAKYHLITRLKKFFQLSNDENSSITQPMQHYEMLLNEKDQLDRL